MGRIYSCLLQFFDADWFFMQNDEEAFLKLPYEGKNGEWMCYAQAMEEQEQFVFYSVHPALAPEDVRQSMAELITRINYGLVIGGFEMDFKDGEVRYKTSIDVKNTALTADLIRPAVYINVSMMDRYLPVLDAVIKGRAAPQEALGRITDT